MARRMSWLMVVGICLSVAEMAQAAEREVVWPTEWTAFGPVLPRYGRLYGFPPPPEDLPSAESLKTIPAELTLGKSVLKAFKIKLDGGRFDFRARFNKTGRGLGVHLWAPVEATADTTVRVGTGADWWTRWHLDGKVVFDTFGRGIVGNGSDPVTGRDHEFDIQIPKGRHVLAVSVIGGNHGFLLAVTSPAEMRAKPLCFKDAMAAGSRRYARPHWSIPLDLPGARADFRRALDLATTDAEQAEARLALADNIRRDIIGKPDAKAIRQQCEAVMAIPGATPVQKGKAAYCLGEALLIENRCAEARAEFEKALGLLKTDQRNPPVEIAIARSHLQEGDYRAAKERLGQHAKNDNLGPVPKFQVQSLLEAAEIAPRIRSDHPRLFINADSWPALKARIEADPKAVDDLRKTAASLPAEFTPDGAFGFWKRLPQAAMAWRVSGDPALLDKIAKLLRASVDHCLRRDVFNKHDANWDIIFAMDWVWDGLSPAQRGSLARDMLRYAYSRHMDDLSSGLQKIEAYAHEYEGGMYWYLGLLLANSGLEAADNARALELLGRGYYNNALSYSGFANRIVRTRGGGTWWSNFDYGLSAYQQPLWAFMSCWKSAVGGKIPDEWTYIGISPEVVLRIALDIRSGDYCIRDFGYSRAWRHSGGWTGYGRDVNSGLARFIHIFGKDHPLEAAIAAHLRGRLAQAGCSSAWIFPVEPLTLDLLPPAETPLPEKLPLARHYDGNALVLMSSGFGPSATYALFCCGRWDPEKKLGDFSEHLDTTHFTIYKRGYLALDSGTRALSEDTSLKGPAGVNYDKASVAHNVVLIRMPDENFGPLVNSNSGGQCMPGNFARPLAFESNGKLFAYIATDATKTYNSNKCAQMVRQFVFLPPDHFAVFDRVVSKSADFPKTWLLHTANEPAITDKEFRVDQDKGRIFCRTLLPADAVLEKIGGPGKEFWADGRNYPIPADSPYLGSMGMKNAGDVPENVGRWRVEVKPKAARTDDVFLHLIQVAGQDVATMVESRVSEKDQQIELTFTAGARSYAIRLNKTGEVGGHIHIAEGDKIMVDRDFSHTIDASEERL